MLHADGCELAPALRPLPEGDVASLDPRDRLAGGITRCRQCNGIEPSAADVMLDSGQRAVGVLRQHFLEEVAERSRVQKSARRFAPVPATADEAHSPRSEERRVGKEW